MKNAIKLLFLFFGAVVYSNNYYVSSIIGNDKNEGSTEQKPFKTIQKAADVVKAGDNVYIMNGTYSESDNEDGFLRAQIVLMKHSGKPDAWITFQALDGHKPLLKVQNFFGIRVLSQNSVITGEPLSYIRIKGLTIEGNNTAFSLCDALNQPKSCKNSTGDLDWKYNCSGISIGSEDQYANHGNTTHHIEILDCEIYNCSGAGVGLYRCDYVTTQGCKIYNNGWTSTLGTSGIHIYNPRNCSINTGENNFVIKKNEIYNNRIEVPFFDGKKCWGYTDGNGIIIDDAYNEQTIKVPFKGKFLIEANVIYENGGSGIVLFQSDNITVRNNTTYKNCQLTLDDKNRAELYVIRAKNVTVNDNIFYARKNQLAFVKGSKVKMKSNSNLVFNAKKGKKLKKSISKDPNFIEANDSPKAKISCDEVQFEVIKNPIQKNLKPNRSIDLNKQIGAF